MNRKYLSAVVLMAAGIGGCASPHAGQESLPSPSGSVHVIADAQPSGTAGIPQWQVTTVSTSITRYTANAGVLFGIDSFELKPAAAEALEQLIARIELRRVTAILVAGYTDSLGSAEHGLWLSRERARRVGTWLIAHGIDERLIRVEGFGEEHPVASNTSEEGRARNRRVEITVTSE